MKHALFIGRWQPFHDGHRQLIQKVIDEGGHPLIGIRDTEKDEKNPYSVAERQEMIAKVFPNVPTIVLPDIESVCYGRDVGYKIREIRLSDDVEAISGTKIRAGL